MDAQKQVSPFSVFQPKGVNAPDGIYVTNDHADNLVAVVFTYSQTPLGSFYVEEATPELTQAQWDQSNKALTTSIGQPGVSGTAQMVQIRNGVQGLATTSADGP